MAFWENLFQNSPMMPQGPQSWIGRNLGISTFNENADMLSREAEIARKYEEYKRRNFAPPANNQYAGGFTGQSSAFMPGPYYPFPVGEAGNPPPPPDGAIPDAEGWTAKTIMPTAKALMGTIPGIGPIGRNFSGVDVAAAGQGEMRPPVNKPNYMPASDPPPDTGNMMPGGMPNTLPAINSVPYAGNASPASTPEGSWRDRNKGWIDELGGAMIGFGGGVAATPPGSPGISYLSQGAAAAGQYVDRSADRKLDRRLKEAKVGEVESKAEQRKATLAFADTIKDPTARSYMKLGLTQKALERLEKLDPEEAQRLIDFEVKKQNALLPGKIAVAQAGKTDVKVALPGKETAFAEARSKVQGKIYEDASAGARAAETILDNVRMARDVLPQVKTGVGTETIAGLKGIAERLGIQTNADAYQTLIAATKKMAFDTLQQFKGPTTERELLFAITASPNVGMTPAALSRALEAVEKSQTWKRRYASEMEKFANENGGTLNPPGKPSFEEHWQGLVDTANKARPEKGSAPPGWRDTGRRTGDGRPIYTDGTREIAPRR